VEVGQDLRVAPRPEAVSARLERGAELRAVVDLAVAHGDDVARLVAKRLGAAGDVDDGEPPAAEGCVAGDRGPVAVRPAVGQRRRHAGQYLLGAPGTVPRDESVDPAHGGSAL